MAEISDHTRKLLWGRSGNRCSFTGCGRLLVEPAQGGSEGTVVGHECHIVAKQEDARIARAVPNLSEDEQLKFASLIKQRHGVQNLVLMCGTHSTLIDDPAQAYSVEAVLAMKSAHEASVQQRLDSEKAEAEGQQMEVVRPLLVEDIPKWQRKAIRALALADAEALEWLRTMIGDPTEPHRVLGLVAAWPAELATAGPELLTALAREAEAAALWPAATEVWENRARRSEGPERADLLVRAAIDAEVGGNSTRRLQLLAEAKLIDPTCVRLRLAEFDPDRHPEKAVKFFRELHTDDPALGSLIVAQRALAHLLQGELEPASEAADEAASLEADSVASRVVRINLEVQRGRMALVAARPTVRRDLEVAQGDALRLREELLDMARWEESARLLMLAADVSLLLRDPATAQELIGRARPEELHSAPEGAEVLGDAALRAGSEELALRLVAEVPSTDAIDRIRATAEVDLGGFGRESALARLEALALSDSDQAEAAAAARILACLHPVNADWNEAMAEILKEGPNEALVERIRVLATIRIDPGLAKELAAALPRTSSGAKIRLQVAGETRDRALMLEAANELVSYAPDGAAELMAAV